MEGEFQDQGQLDKDLEEWLSPRGNQPNCRFFSEEEKRQSIYLEVSAPEEEIISNQAPERETSTMVVVKCSENVEGSGDNIYSPLCGGLYKEQDDYLVPWSVTDPYAKMTCFNWSKQNNYWIFPGDQYNKEFKNWRGPIHNGQFRSNTLKQKRNTEETCSKYAGSAKFNGIPREGNT